MLVELDEDMWLLKYGDILVLSRPLAVNRGNGHHVRAFDHPKALDMIPAGTKVLLLGGSKMRKTEKRVTELSNDCGSATIRDGRLVELELIIDSRELVEKSADNAIRITFNDLVDAPSMLRDLISFLSTVHSELTGSSRASE